MRKVILNMMVSLDGYIEGPDHDLSWHRADDEFNQHTINFMKSVDTILFGRINYRIFESYWPAAAKDPATSKDDLEIANSIENAHKIVFSQTMDNVEWNNSRLVKDNIAEEIAKLKQQPGKDIVMYGGANIAQYFMQLGLIEVYRLYINPVILGSGTPLFGGSHKKLDLKLSDTTIFGSGMVLLTYHPVQ